MSEEELKSMRHSLAHIMAQAIQHLWPQAKFGVGPAIDNGFYYDVYLDNGTISEADLPKIEEEMRKIVAANYPFERRDVSVEEAIDWAISGNQSFKVELLNDLKRSGTTIASELAGEKMGSVSDGDSKVETVSLYSQGDYTDLCRGGHVDSTGKVGAFQLTKTAGAYWRGNENNPQMQRIYGVAFATQEELDEYLNRLEIAKQRDHRKLGKELDLYTTSSLVGIGLPLFTPRGTILRDIVAQYSNQLRQKFGFEKVWTPHITKKDLYETSGQLSLLWVNSKECLIGVLRVMSDNMVVILSTYSSTVSLIVKTRTCSGAAQNGNHPPVCSINTLKNRSIEPNKAQ